MRKWLSLRACLGNQGKRPGSWPGASAGRAEFDPSVGITLHVGGGKIQIKGRNLNAEIRPNVRLFQGLTRHRVPWIQEADNATRMESGGKGILVESIEW